MLFQPTNIIPDTRTGIGFGVVDASSDVQFSWQVNGDYPVMTAFQLIIYENDTASTQLYDTGKLTNGCPFSGRDDKGDIKFYTYTISSAALTTAGITNGNEYKFTIRQYYMDGGAETSILQSSASVFMTRSAPSFAMVSPSVTTAEYTFTWTYSQAQGDTLEWIRYQIRLIGTSSVTMLYDSGSIYGVTAYQCTYSGLINGQHYEVRALGQTSSGVRMETPWTSFTPSYSITAVDGVVIPTCATGYNAIHINWTMAATTTGQDSWVLYRKRGDNTEMQKVGVFPISMRAVYDFGAGSGQGPYYYYLFAAVAGNPSATPPTPTQYLSYAIISTPISPISYCWSLLDTVEDSDGTFRVMQEFDFKSNLDSGTMSNNNSPNVLANFTPMPTVQLSPANYKSGSLSSLLGSASAGAYSKDTMALRNALMLLSTTEDTLFLKGSKGDVMMVRINGPISAAVADTTGKQPQTITVPWIEVDDTPESVIAYPNDAVFG